MSADLVVVHVEDAISEALAGHAGCTYVSPPLPRDNAVELVTLLLGGAAVIEPNSDTWIHPVAGGRRTIALLPAPAG